GIRGTPGRSGAPGVEPAFVRVWAPRSRGILATSFVELRADTTADAVAALYADAYAHEPFVRFVRDRPPEVAAVAGSNYAEVGFTLAAPANGTRTLAIVSATDNLIKGGAGHALPDLNPILRPPPPPSPPIPR